MKYVKREIFTTGQFSIAETIDETRDVITIAMDIIDNMPDVSDDVKKSLDLVINNLNQATDYLNHIQRKTDVALQFVPTEVQKKECL